MDRAAYCGLSRYGEVRLATRKEDGATVAVKFVTKKADDGGQQEALMASECSVLKAIVHPGRWCRIHQGLPTH